MDLYVDSPFKKSAVSRYNSHLKHQQCLHCISDQFDVILMDIKCAFLSKTRTFLSDPKLFNGSVVVAKGNRFAKLQPGECPNPEAAALQPVQQTKYDAYKESRDLRAHCCPCHLADTVVEGLTKSYPVCYCCEWSLTTSDTKKTTLLHCAGFQTYKPITYCLDSTLSSKYRE